MLTVGALNVTAPPERTTPDACPAAETVKDVAASDKMAAVVGKPESKTPIAVAVGPVAVTIVGARTVTDELVIAPAMWMPCAVAVVASELREFVEANEIAAPESVFVL
jgi:hypothetical protein